MDPPQEKEMFAPLNGMNSNMLRQAARRLRTLRLIHYKDHVSLNTLKNPQGLELSPSDPEATVREGLNLLQRVARYYQHTFLYYNIQDLLTNIHLPTDYDALADKLDTFALKIDAHVKGGGHFKVEDEDLFEALALAYYQPSTDTPPSNDKGTPKKRVPSAATAQHVEDVRNVSNERKGWMMNQFGQFVADPDCPEENVRVTMNFPTFADEIPTVPASPTSYYYGDSSGGAFEYNAGDYDKPVVNIKEKLVLDPGILLMPNLMDVVVEDGVERISRFRGLESSLVQIICDFLDNLNQVHDANYLSLEVDDDDGQISDSEERTCKLKAVQDYIKILKFLRRHLQGWNYSSVHGGFAMSTDASIATVQQSVAKFYQDFLKYRVKKVNKNHDGSQDRVGPSYVPYTDPTHVAEKYQSYGGQSLHEPSDPSTHVIGSGETIKINNSAWTPPAPQLWAKPGSKSGPCHICKQRFYCQCMSITNAEERKVEVPELNTHCPGCSVMRQYCICDVL